MTTSRNSVAIWVTVGVKAAIGSNLYFDDIVVRDGRVLQEEVQQISGRGGGNRLHL